MGPDRTRSKPSDSSLFTADRINLWRYLAFIVDWFVCQTKSDSLSHIISYHTPNRMSFSFWFTIKKVIKLVINVGITYQMCSDVLRCAPKCSEQFKTAQNECQCRHLNTFKSLYLNLMQELSRWVTWIARSKDEQTKRVTDYEVRNW